MLPAQSTIVPANREAGKHSRGKKRKRKNESTNEPSRAGKSAKKFSRGKMKRVDL